MVTNLATNTYLLNLSLIIDDASLPLWATRELREALTQGRARSRYDPRRSLFACAHFAGKLSARRISREKSLCSSRSRRHSAHETQESI